MLPLVVTKLYVPPPRPRIVPRQRLIARLDAGLHRKLTLISAPAGFGKTTLVSEWLAGTARPAAWLSLDEEDSDPARFLAYLVAAVQTAAPSVGGGVTAALQSAQPPPAETLLAGLVNDLATLPTGIVIVLDDYHAVDAPAVDHALAYLVDHLPPQVHLVITTREDPRLPLARLRARDQLTELRAADMRFTAPEAAEFLTRVMGLTIAAADISALEERTEGWIAGLQLAAISMQGVQDTAGFIEAFTGSHRYVMDYLVDDVLQRQPGHVQQFLLRTSILDQLCAPLCDAVLGEMPAAGQETLDYLERANLFLVPLDNERRWYRYHHLFAELLRQRLHEEAHAHPEGATWDIATLHRRASAWLEKEGATTDAIRHALAAEDFDRAAGLIELTWPAMQRLRQDATALGWMRALPDDLFGPRPVLHIAYVGALLSNGSLEDLEGRLRDIERWVERDPGGATGPSAAPVVVDHEAFHRLPGAIAVYRAGLALIAGNVPATVTHARKALTLIADDNHLWYGAASALLGLASWTRGDLEDAHEAYADGMARLLQAGNVADAIGGSLALADIRITQGRLRQAIRTCERALQLAIDRGEPAMRGTADMHLALSELFREQHDLEAAARHLARSTEQGEHTGFPQHRYRWRVIMARLRQADGDAGGALDLLQEAERLYESDFYPNVRPVAAWRARVLASGGRLDEALDWVRDRRLTVDDEPSFLREFEHVTLARILLAQARANGDAQALPAALGLLARLAQAADAGGRTGSAIEIRILQSLAHEAAGERVLAVEALERALALAEPEGYVRIFIDEGAPMIPLLAASGGGAPAYAARLLTLLKVEDQHAPAAPAMPLAGVLSQRELEVMRLVVEGLSNREIAERLYLALDTVKGHNRRIFDKLGVQRRTEAIARARELGLAGR